MELKKYQPIIETISISVLVYLLHKFIFWLNSSNPKLQNFHFNLETTYGFFLICSVIIVSILMIVKKKNIDNVGFAFIWVTFIKIGFSYTALSLINNANNSNVKFEKINFFLIFAIFLTIETIITIRFLNNKDVKKL